MLTRETMRGLYVLTITPFDSENRLDEAAYRENVQYLVSLGVDGIVTTGTNGEFHTTTDEERTRIARLLVEETRGTVSTVVGASGVNTAEAISRTRAARDAGADAVMNVVPYYHVLSKDEACQYFEDLYSACPDIGIIVLQQSADHTSALERYRFHTYRASPDYLWQQNDRSGLVALFELPAAHTNPSFPA
jgi:dihydrodipicolinate synthase/N-acetylneuraminate lyase